MHIIQIFKKIKIAYYRSEKTAGSTTSILLAHLCDLPDDSVTVIDSLESLIYFPPDDYFKVTTVRNPWERLVSAYFHITFHKKLSQPYCISFFDLVTKLYNGEIGKISPLDLQSKNCENIKFDLIIRVSNYDEDIKKLFKIIDKECEYIIDNKGASITSNYKYDIPVYNLTPSEFLPRNDNIDNAPKNYQYIHFPCWKEFYTPELIDMVREIYKLDIILYNIGDYNKY